MAKGGKKLKKKKKKRVLTKKAKLGDFWTNYDNYIIIYCRVGTGPVASYKITYRDTTVPAPVFDKKSIRRDSDTKFTVKGYGRGTFNNPIRKLSLRRKDGHTNSTFSDVGGSGGTKWFPFPGDTDNTGIQTFTEQRDRKSVV